MEKQTDLEKDYDELRKVILVGDEGVGTIEIKKTVEGIFTDDYKMTIGADFFLKRLNIKGKRLILRIWDINSKEHFSYIRTSEIKFICEKKLRRSRTLRSEINSHINCRRPGPAAPGV